MGERLFCAVQHSFISYQTILRLVVSLSLLLSAPLVEAVMFYKGPTPGKPASRLIDDILFDHKILHKRKKCLEMNADYSPFFMMHAGPQVTGHFSQTESHMVINKMKFLGEFTLFPLPFIAGYLGGELESNWLRGDRPQLDVNKVLISNPSENYFAIKHYLRTDHITQNIAYAFIVGDLSFLPFYAVYGNYLMPFGRYASDRVFQLFDSKLTALGFAKGEMYSFNFSRDLNTYASLKLTALQCSKNYEVHEYREEYDDEGKFFHDEGASWRFRSIPEKVYGFQIESNFHFLKYGFTVGGSYINHIAFNHQTNPHAKVHVHEGNESDIFLRTEDSEETAIQTNETVPGIDIYLSFSTGPLQFKAEYMRAWDKVKNVRSLLDGYQPSILQGQMACNFPIFHQPSSLVIACEKGWDGGHIFKNDWNIVALMTTQVSQHLKLAMGFKVNTISIMQHDFEHSYEKGLFQLELAF